MCILLVLTIHFILFFSKFEEVQPLRVQHFIEENETEKRRQIVKFEKTMLKHLQFRMHRPTIFEFLELYHEVNEFSVQIQFLAIVSNFIDRK